MLRSSITAVVVISLMFGASQVQADHHEAAEVEAGIKKFYSQLSAGKFKQAFSHIAIGASGYVAEGELTTIADEATRDTIVGMLEQGKQAGGEMDLTPKNIKVTSHGNVFVATYQVDAKVKAPGEDEMTERMTRGTLVWSKTDDGLKVVHWHISEPVSED